MGRRPQKRVTKTILNTMLCIKAILPLNSIHQCHLLNQSTSHFQGKKKEKKRKEKRNELDSEAGRLEYPLSAWRPS